MQPIARSGVTLRLPDRCKRASAQVEVVPTHSIGAIVMHSSEGICTIERISKMRFGDQAEQLYYILKPSIAKNSSVVYMPVTKGNEALRKLLTVQDIDRIITESLDVPSVWVDDNKHRKERFQEILSQRSYPEMIRMVRDIHIHTEKRIQNGKKSCASDEALLAEAESVLHQEFGYVLGLEESEVPFYIRQRLEASA